MRSTSFYFLSLAFFIFPFRSAAQYAAGGEQNNRSASASTGQMQGAIDIPVSHFTGKAAVSLPILAVKSKSISVDIGLSYDAGGVKVEQQPGWAGLGWQLEAGGMVSRVIRGNPDEGVRRHATKVKRYNNGILIDAYWPDIRDSMITAAKQGGYYTDGNGGINIADLNNAVTTSNSQVNTNNPPYFLTLPEDQSRFFLGLTDGEADLYYFNFPGLSGKFTFGVNREIITVPYREDISIRPVYKTIYDTLTSSYFNPQGSTLTTVEVYFKNVFESWVIVTDDGREYYFGESPESRLNSGYSTDETFLIYNAWSLTKIIDKNTKDTVRFDYDRKIRKYTTTVNRQKFVEESVWATCPNTASSNTQTLIETTFESRLRLITTRTTTASLYYNEARFSMDSLIVRDIASQKKTSHIQFDYGKFPSGRLKLTGYLTRDLQRERFLPYSFKYDEPAGYTGIFAQDFWGYYNGATNATIWPSGSSCTVNKTERRPAWPQMRAESLTEIENPAGGKTILDYEPHLVGTVRNFDNSVSGNGNVYSYQNYSLDDIVGGLRVKKIMKVDPFTRDTLFTNYSYNVFGGSISSGHLYDAPSIIIPMPNYYCGGITYKQLLYVSTNNLYEGSGNGAHVGYKNVSVTNTRNGISNGREEFEFYNDTNTDSAFYSNVCGQAGNGCLYGDYSIYGPWQSRHLLENLLGGYTKEKRVYDSLGRILSLEKPVYQAKIYPGIARVTRITTLSKTDLCGGMPQWNYEMFVGPGQRPWSISGSTLFYLKTYVQGKMAVLTKQNISVQTDIGGRAASDTVSYFYESPYHSKPTTIIKRASLGDSSRQRVLYSWDFPAAIGGDSTYHFMKKAFINQQVAEFMYKGQTILGGGYNKFKMRSRQDSARFYLEEEYKLTISAAGLSNADIGLNTTYPAALNTSAAVFKKMASYTYSTDGRPLSVLARGGYVKSSIWNPSETQIIAQAENAAQNEIAYTGFEIPYEGGWGNGRDTSLAFAGQKATILTSPNYLYKSGFSPLKRYVVSYWKKSSQYDSPATINVNSTSGTLVKTTYGWGLYEHVLPLGTTYIAIGGGGIIDEIRVGPVDARMTTYAFKPGVGLVQKIGATHQMVRYEYDGLGAIIRERDGEMNIIRQMDFFTTVSGSALPVWRLSGKASRKKICSLNSSYYDDILQYEEVNVNPNSTTPGEAYLDRRWVDKDPLPNDSITAWQNTGLTRCVKNGTDNTGWQEAEQKDMNPCSFTYNYLRWVSTGVNTVACPLPCAGEGYKIYNGACTLGTKVYFYSSYTCSSCSTYTNKYYYYWPDCTRTVDYTETSSIPKTIGSGCIAP